MDHKDKERVQILNILALQAYRQYNIEFLVFYKAHFLADLLEQKKCCGAERNLEDESLPTDRDIFDSGNRVKK